MWHEAIVFIIFIFFLFIRKLPFGTLSNSYMSLCFNSNSNSECKSNQNNRGNRVPLCYTKIVFSLYLSLLLLFYFLFYFICRPEPKNKNEIFSNWIRLFVFSFLFSVYMSTFNEFRFSLLNRIVYFFFHSTALFLFINRITHFFSFFG